MVKFGFLTIPRWPLEETISHYRLAEEKGFDYVWVADYANSRSLYPVLTMTALNTKRIKFGPCVTNPFTRHPAITATSIATLNELSGGRVVLGIGAGDETILKSLGITRKIMITTMRETVAVIRKIMGGEKVVYTGKTLQISDFSLFYKPKRVAPVYIGARGRGMLQLAGEIGDGVLMDLSHPVEVKIALDEVRKGAKKTGRKVDDMDLATSAIFSVASDVEKAKDSVRWIVALIASNASPDVLERHDIDIESAKTLRDALQKEGLEKAAKMTTEEMLKAFSISGNADFCVDTLEKLEKTGLTQIVCMNVDSQIARVKEQLELLDKSILPHFRK